MVQNLYILNVHCLIGSVLLPRKEVLGDGVQDVGAEHLRQRPTISENPTIMFWGNTLSWTTSFVTGFVHFTIGMFMLMTLNLFGLQTR